MSRLCRVALTWSRFVCGMWQKALKLALLEQDTVWDALKGQAFIVKLPNFGYDPAKDENNSLVRGVALCACPLVLCVCLCHSVFV